MTRNGRLSVDGHTGVTAGGDMPAFIPAGRDSADARADARPGARTGARTRVRGSAQPDTPGDAAELRELAELALRGVEAAALAYGAALRRIEDKRAELARTLRVAERRGVDAELLRARLIVAGIPPADVLDAE